MSSLCMKKMDYEDSVDHVDLDYFSRPENLELSMEGWGASSTDGIVPRYSTSSESGGSLNDTCVNDGACSRARQRSPDRAVPQMQGEERPTVSRTVSRLLDVNQLKPEPARDTSNQRPKSPGTPERWCSVPVLMLNVEEVITAWDAALDRRQVGPSVASCGPCFPFSGRALEADVLARLPEVPHGWAAEPALSRTQRVQRYMAKKRKRQFAAHAPEVALYSMVPVSAIVERRRRGRFIDSESDSQ